MKKIIFCAALAWPISFIAELIFKVPIFTTYNQFLEVIYRFIQNWWDWLLIAGLTYLFSKRILGVKYQTKEMIRERQFEYEVARWRDTPYVSPLMFYYLTHPPVPFQSTSPVQTALHKLYHRVIHYFRDRVFINEQFTIDRPFERTSYLKVIGYLELAKTILFMSLIIGYVLGVTISEPKAWITDWERFTIPFLVYFSLSFSMKIQAYVEMTYSDLDNMLQSYYGVVEPKIIWRDVFPDQEKGQVILNAWQSENEKRERYMSLSPNMILPPSFNDNGHPFLAPYPYPATDLPNWTGQLELYYTEKKFEWEEKNKQNNIVEFKKKRSIK